DIIGRFDDRKVSKLDWQAAFGENFLDLREVSTGALDSGGGSFFDTALRPHALDVNAICRGDARPFAVNVCIRSIVLADLDDFINFSHIEGIEKDQLRTTELAKNPFPEFYGRFQTGGNHKGRGIR